MSSGSVSSVTPESASHMVLCPHQVTLVSLTAFTVQMRRSAWPHSRAKACWATTAIGPATIVGQRAGRLNAITRNQTRPSASFSTRNASSPRSWWPGRVP